MAKIYVVYAGVLLYVAVLVPWSVMEHAWAALNWQAHTVVFATLWVYEARRRFEAEGPQ